MNGGDGLVFCFALNRYVRAGGFWCSVLPKGTFLQEVLLIGVESVAKFTAGLSSLVTGLPGPTFATQAFGPMHVDS